MLPYGRVTRLPFPISQRSPLCNFRRALLGNGRKSEGGNLGVYPLVRPTAQARPARLGGEKSAKSLVPFSRKVPFLIFAKYVHGHIRTIKAGKNFHRFYDTFRHEIDIQQGAQTSVLLCVQSIQYQNEKSNFCIEQSYTVHCDITLSWL